MYSSGVALDCTIRLNFPQLWNIPQLFALECLVVAKFQNSSPVAANASALNTSEREMSVIGITVIKAHSGYSWITNLPREKL
jgi:hypothetical protein